MTDLDDALTRWIADAHAFLERGDYDLDELNRLLALADELVAAFEGRNRTVN